MDSPTAPACTPTSHRRNFPSSSRSIWCTRPSTPSPHSAIRSPTSTTSSRASDPPGRPIRSHPLPTPPLPDPAAPGPPHSTTPSDPDGRYAYGLLLLDLTDRLSGAPDLDRAAALVDQVLDPADGLLARLADFFEAAGEKAKESEDDDAFDLGADFEEAAAQLRDVGDTLQDATERMAALAPTPSPVRAPRSLGSAVPVGITRPVPGRSR
ncbi:hypothetical protein K7B10_07820 [Streptomyces flavotricini]|uniref:Uncharacterized protein n=1 Tax=Streptomyces flavotricini TaxID=66888 RepID=A0ABS8E0M3_9ACTN|nr:hypothetical protein [Streptomyces flavotricini]MCC0094692.1 hypothetical protein [Streptomyces flavotricini]